MFFLPVELARHFLSQEQEDDPSRFSLPSASVAWAASPVG